jgi:hypothetical protein
MNENVKQWFTVGRSMVGIINPHDIAPIGVSHFIRAGWTDSQTD